MVHIKLYSKLYHNTYLKEEHCGKSYLAAKDAISLYYPFRFGDLGGFFAFATCTNETLLSIKCAFLLRADMKQTSSSRQLRLVNQYFSTDLFMPLISIPVLEI